MPLVSKNVTNDPGFLSAALEGLELQRRRIEEQIAAVKSLLGGRSVGRPSASAAVVVANVASSAAPRKKRVLSAAARKRIADAQKKRWAEFRKKSN